MCHFNSTLIQVQNRITMSDTQGRASLDDSLFCGSVYRKLYSNSASLAYNFRTFRRPRDGRPRNRGSIPDNGIGSSSSPNSSDRLWYIEWYGMGGTLPGVKAAGGVELTTRLHLQTSLRMGEAVLLLPHIPSLCVT
jgi:hypothetical protein